MENPIRLTPPVARALAAGEPVVALETSVLAQGLPTPANREAAQRMAVAIERTGAVAAFAAVVEGVPSFGLTDEELARFLARTGIAKLSARDIAAAIREGKDGATTVAAALALMPLAGIRVFATGGIGGVHRRSTVAASATAAIDESADLLELARTSAIVVCAGAKSILDLTATMERIETLGVSIVGYRTRELPGFLCAETGIALAHCVERADEIARLYLIERSLSRPGAMLVVQQPPATHALTRAQVDEVVARGLDDAARRGIDGPALTPFLLAELGRLTEGRSLAANLALLEANAKLAGEIAVELGRVR